jgi:hypothetical protein
MILFMAHHIGMHIASINTSITLKMTREVFSVNMTCHIISNIMNTLDDNVIMCILSYLQPEDIRRMHKTSVRIFRIVIGNAHLRYKLYDSWEDSVKAFDVEVFDLFAKSCVIPQDILTKRLILIHNKLFALKCLHANGYKWNNRTSVYIASCGSLECLQYAHEQGCDWDLSTCIYAARSCSVECLKYAHENGCEWDDNVCTDAAVCGSLECLRYAHEHGCPWNMRTCTSAAVSNSLECLRYAHENGCEWNAYVCLYATVSNSVRCLQYAHENGCAWHGRVCANATLCGSLECLKYAHEHGCPINIRQCIDLAILDKSAKCLQYLQHCA